MMIIQGLQFLDLFNKIGLFIIKLFILGAVVVELGQEVNEAVFVPEEDLQDWAGLVGVGHKHLLMAYAT